MGSDSDVVGSGVWGIPMVFTDKILAAALIRLSGQRGIDISG